MKMYSEYRAQARATLKGRWNEMALLMLVIMLIICAFESPFMFGTLQAVETAYLWGSGCNVLATLAVTVPLIYALMNLCLIYARGEQLQDNYFVALFKDFAAHWVKYFLSGMLIFVLVMLIAIPTMFIGAIILGLAYGLVPYVIHDNPEIGVREALKTSRLMMRGHKWELFVLELTFIGWALLCILTFGIGVLWLEPYMIVSYAHFYDDVKAEYDMEKATL